MVLMSHNEPLHNHNTHHVCLPAFHSLCFPFTSTAPHKWCSCDGLSNGVLSHSTNVMCHPLLSPTQSHPHSCLPSQQTHTPCGKCHHSKCKTPRHNHGEGHSADACTQGQGRGAQCVGCDWLAWRLHQRQWGIDTVPSNNLLRKETVFTWSEQQRRLSTWSNKPSVTSEWW